MTERIRRGACSAAARAPGLSCACRRKRDALQPLGAASATRVQVMPLELPGHGSRCRLCGLLGRRKVIVVLRVDIYLHDVKHMRNRHIRVFLTYIKY